MMENTLLSIDWDYFMPYIKNLNCSYIENSRNTIAQWYKRYFENKASGIDIIKSLNIGYQLKGFWNKIHKHFKINDNAKVIISDSHKLSYDIAEKNSCSEVYSFDSHSDLGYGGIASLKFEVNCANWLGKLLKDHIINKAHIIYSPYSGEKPDDFNQLNHILNIRYNKWDDLNSGIRIRIVHICRSGAWTPPWLDNKFLNFVKDINLPFQIIECCKRNWNPDKLNLSSKIDLML